MSTSFIISGSVCTRPDCILTSSLLNLHGLDKILKIEELGKQSNPGDGVFLFVGGKKCTPEPDSISDWFLALLELSSVLPRVRSWPIVLASPHPQRLLRDLLLQTGFDLRCEQDLHVVNLGHEIAGADGPLLCEDSRILVPIRQRLQALMVSTTAYSSATDRLVVGACNLRQALSAMRHMAAASRRELHMHRSAESSKKAGDGVGRLLPDRLNGALSRLSPVLAEESRTSLLALGNKMALECDDANEELEYLAILLEDGAALLEAGIRGMGRGDSPRIVAFFIDDDPSLYDKARKAQPSNMPRVDFIGLPLPSEQISEVVSVAENCGGDPSEAVAQVMYTIAAESIIERHGETEWRANGTQFVVVVDVRLHPLAPDAGLGIIRRLRDSFPFVKTIALTVRRSLAFDLAGEGADAYVLKTETADEALAEMWEAMRQVTMGARTFHAFQGNEFLEEDPLLRELILTKHMMRSANSGEANTPSLLFCRQQELVNAIKVCPPRAILAVFVEAETDSSALFRILASVRSLYDRKPVLLRPVPGWWSGLKVRPTDVIELDRRLSGERIAKHDVRWTILVPTDAHCGDLRLRVPEDKLREIRAAIAERFGGATTSDSSGVWLRPSDRTEIRDEVERVEVWARRTLNGRNYILRCAQDLVHALGQEEIFVQEESIVNWSVTSKPPSTAPSIVAPDGRIIFDFEKFSRFAVGPET